MVRYTLQQRIFLYDTYMNEDLLENSGDNVDVNFVMKLFPADKQFIIRLINLD
jgi:hypothetical protein